MGLSIGPDEFDSLALGDTPLEALMLGDVELWSATEPAPAGVVPMSWSGGSVSNPTTERTVVTYTVVGSGLVRLDAAMTGSGYSRHPQYFTNQPGTRSIYAYVNGIRVLYSTQSSIGTTTAEGTAEVVLVDGDVVTFSVRSTGQIGPRIDSWSFEITPLRAGIYGFTQELGPGFATRYIADGEVATHVIQDYTGMVAANITTHWTNSYSTTSYHEVWKNGTRLTQQGSSRGTNLTTSTTVYVDVVPGDELMFRLSVTSTTPAVQEYDNTIISIA